MKRSGWVSQSIFWMCIGNMTDETNNTAIKEILEQRGSRYGEFRDQSIISMGLKNTLRYEFSDDLCTLTVRAGWARMEPYQQNAVDMICDKLARALNGDPNYLDNWDDIQGYAKLVSDRLRKEGRGHG